MIRSALIAAAGSSSSILALGAAAGLTNAAAAQTPSFIYHFDIANPNLAPGQWTTVKVLCGFSPPVGSLVTTTYYGPRPVLGLSSGSFDLLGTGGSWSGLSLLTFPYTIGSMPGLVVGSNVHGPIWGTGFGPPLGFVSTLNPTPLWQATVTAPPTPGPITLTIVPVGSHGVWAGNPGEFAVEALSSQTTGAQTIINVIPAPGVVVLLALAGLAKRHR